LNAVRELKIPHAGSQVSGRVTISIGAACTVPAAPLTEALLSHADAAMYQAKRRGRDQFAMEALSPIAADSRKVAATQPDPDAAGR
jgi:diguanylate cyclase (GGDEF)-like protein